MALSTPNPAFSLFHDDWTKLQDAYDGQRTVKEKTTIYLPPTSGMVIDGYPKPNTSGTTAYEAYISRARFPNFLREAVEIAVGMMHRHDAVIKVPKAMEPMLSNLSTTGETAQEVLRRINHDQLLLGRLGLLLDFPTTAEIGKDFPYIAFYHASSAHNWDDGERDKLVGQTLNLVVLNESEFVRNVDFEWEWVKKYRVLALGPTETNESVGVYRFGVFFEEENFNEDKMQPAVFRGESLNFIPFLFVNSVDLVSTPAPPPLMDLAELCFTIYRGEADFRQNLFMQGQDTLVIEGGEDGSDEARRVGAGAVLNVPMGGSAKYIGVESKGLSEQREALKEDRMRAGGMGAGVLDTTQRERESGESLDTRIAARTADLNQIADTGAMALSRMLKMAAIWMGHNPEEIEVIPNKDFGDIPISTQSLVEIQAAKNSGAPISAKSIHRLMQKRRFTSNSFEDEEAEIKAEKGGIFDPIERMKQVADLNPNNTGPNQQRQKEE